MTFFKHYCQLISIEFVEKNMHGADKFSKVMPFKVSQGILIFLQIVHSDRLTDFLISRPNEIMNFIYKWNYYWNLIYNITACIGYVYK